MYRSHVLVCGGTGCTSSGSQAIIDKFEAEIEKNGLKDEVAVVRTGCHGLCALGPIVLIYPEGVHQVRLFLSCRPERDCSLLWQIPERLRLQGNKS